MAARNKGRGGLLKGAENIHQSLQTGWRRPESVRAVLVNERYDMAVLKEVWGQ